MLAVARLTVASETMQQEENINLQQRENKFSLCNKLILSAIGNQRFPIYGLASSREQIVESAEYDWFKILCTYVLLSNKNRVMGLAFLGLGTGRRRLRNKAI